jgi:hypothetical protein
MSASRSSWGSYENPEIDFSLLTNCPGQPVVLLGTTRTIAARTWIADVSVMEPPAGQSVKHVSFIQYLGAAIRATFTRRATHAVPVIDAAFFR